jgi:hypothetical protein
MGWNGSGTYSRIHNWVQDNLAGINILPDRHDAEDDSIAQGLNNTLTKDGQNSPSGNLPMAGFRHQNVGEAAARTDYARVDQVQDGDYEYALATGSGGAYSANYQPAITAFTAGMLLRFQANHTNSGAATLSVNGLAAKNIVLDDGSTALTGSEIASGQFVEVTYDGTSFRLGAPRITAFGRSLIDDSDAAAGRTTLALGTAAVKNTGVSGDAVPVLNGAATTWAETITVQGTGVGDYFVARSTDAGSSGGPSIVIDRDSASPAASDNLGTVKFRGNDSGGATELYAQIQAQIVDATAAAEYGRFSLATVQNSVVNDVVWVGGGLWMEGAAGGDPGAGKINASELQVSGHKVEWTYGSVVATTSGTSVTLSNAIPSWATEIEIILIGVSTNTANQPPLIQLGDSGGVETSGYVSVTGVISGSSAAEAADTDGFTSYDETSFAAATAVTGSLKLTRWDASDHLWIAEGKFTDGTLINLVSGIKTTSAVLSSVFLTTTGGAATFDAGNGRVRYRG